MSFELFSLDPRGIGARASPNGEINQWQYSGLAMYRGLATGDFRKWKSASKYRSESVELYLVPEAGLSLARVDKPAVH